MTNYPTITDLQNSKVSEKKPNKYKYIVGIDPGVNTGVAVYDRHKKIFISICTLSLHKALESIKALTEWDNVLEDNEKHFVRVEDARKRTWFGNTGKERLKGAGSIERDCRIWEDFLTDLKVDFEMVHPKNSMTKLSAETFGKLTGLTGRTSQHVRDAAGLCIGF